VRLKPLLLPSTLLLGVLALTAAWLVRHDQAPAGISAIPLIILLLGVARFAGWQVRKHQKSDG
jgi:hypothetical protein